MSINNMSVYLQEECQSIYLSIFISLYKRNGVRPLTEIGLREKLLVRVKKKKKQAHPLQTSTFKTFKSILGGAGNPAATPHSPGPWVAGA